MNKVIGHTLDPKLEEVIGVLYDLVNKNKAGADAKKDEPAKKSLIQTGAEGVPVYVDPVIMKNNLGESDLQQREYIIDGISGIDFVQTDAQKDETIVMNVDGKNIEVTPDDSLV
jgi:hypothetical protein